MRLMEEQGPGNRDRAGILLGLPRGVVNAERSAFAEGNERKLLLRFYPSSAAKVPYNELIRIKFEVDTNPPGLFSTEFRPLLLPSPCKVRLYDGPSLFAGKMHALLCRGWSRVKGRDLYDFLFYLSKGIALNMPHLKAKIVASHYIPQDAKLTGELLQEFLERKFSCLDYRQAEDDVRPFIRRPEELDVWDADFFIAATKQYLPRCIRI